MNERMDMVRSFVPHDQNLFPNISSGWIAASVTIFCVLLLALITGHFTRALSAPAQAGSEITIPSANEATSVPMNEKPLILPKDEASAQPGAADTQVNVNVNSSNSSGTTGTVTVNGKTTELKGNDSFHKDITTLSGNGTASVDISVSSGSSGSSTTQLDIESRSSSEADMND